MVASTNMRRRRSSSSSRQSWSDLSEEGKNFADGSEESQCVAAPSSECTETTSEGGRSASKESPALCDDDVEEDRVSLPATECDWPLTPRLQCQDPSVTAASHIFPASPELPCPKVLAPVPQTPGSAASHPSSPTVAASASNSWFRVACLGGVEVRDGPQGHASRTGVVLPVNEIVEVCEELPCLDGCIYLRLADGRGWAFDDSALMPHDPSMVRGRWEQSKEDSPSPPLLTQQSSSPPPLLSSTPAPDWWQAGQVRAAQASHQPLGAVDFQASAVAMDCAVATTQEPARSWFRVAFLGGINLRTGPSIDAPLTGVTLPQNTLVSVAEEVLAEDGRLFLRICDGYSWVFDDSALIPEDPSVMRCAWVQQQPNVWCLIDAGTVSGASVAKSPSGRNRVRQRLNRRNRKSAARA
eukprot:TRINITY_DN73057_c0_g1_i1.p1 TRINITY_DN73057_c0_g1~~TRINITY_DN73057_c0_g1_i1.p1  ORF type:complete len:434 (-),score=64.84 TRINITY_DN73057_c0_g1_i1:143-1378(-)